MRLFHIVILLTMLPALGQQDMALKQFTYYDGLPSDHILAIGQDSLGLITIQTDKGYSVFNGGDFYDLDTVSEAVLVSSSLGDSLPASVSSRLGDVQISVTFSDRQGSLWVGTDQGLWYFPADVEADREVFIQFYGLNNQRTPTKSNKLVVPYTFETLTIGYASTDYTSLGRDQFRYRIQGVHQDWVPTRDHKVQFTSLPHGATYYFEVSVLQENGQWSAPAGLSMKFEQAFYRSAWFLGLLALLALVVLIWSIRTFYNRKANLASMKSQMKELEGQALQSQMNPHFVFNSLNSIQSFISAGEGMQAEIYLAKFSGLLRQTLEHSRSERISLTAEVALLERYLELESMRFGERLKYHVSIGKEVESDLISVPAMLVQPFVENAIVHGIGPKQEGGTVTVNFAQTSDQLLICTISDDGVGRKNHSESVHRSLGTDIVKRRLALLEGVDTGSVTYRDLVDERGESNGTEVIVRIPI